MVSFHLFTTPNISVTLLHCLFSLFYLFFLCSFPSFCELSHYFFFSKFLEVSLLDLSRFVRFKNVVFTSTSFSFNLASVVFQASSVLFLFSLTQGTHWLSSRWSPYCPTACFRKCLAFHILVVTSDMFMIILRKLSPLILAKKFSRSPLGSFAISATCSWLSWLPLGHISLFFPDNLMFLFSWSFPFVSPGLVTFPHDLCVTTEQWAAQWEPRVLPWFIIQSCYSCCLFCL